MKLALTYILLFLLPIEKAFSQTIDDPKLTSIQVFTFYNGDSVSGASGFIALYKGQYYLVTNYHVLTNKEASDTTMFKDNRNWTPNEVHVYFHTKNGASNRRKIFAILNPNTSERKFFTFPATPGKTAYNTIDIAVLPITIPEKDILISAIDISNLNQRWEIKPKTHLYIYGFPGRNTNRKYPDVTTLTSTSDRSYNYTDRNIIATANADLEGASGSPAYIGEGRQKEFVGIQAGIAKNYKSFINPCVICTSHNIFSLFSHVVK